MFNQTGFGDTSGEHFCGLVIKGIILFSLKIRRSARDLETTETLAEFQNKRSITAKGSIDGNG